MSRPTPASSPMGVLGVTNGDHACTDCTVCLSQNRAVPEVVARLVNVAEDLARLADAVLALSTQPPPAPVIVQTPQEQADERTAWTVAAFAESISAHEDTVRRLLRSGELRGFKINQEWRISEDERKRWVAAMEQRTADELGVA